MTKLYPVSHLSYSAIRSYLSDRNMFNKAYIKKIYDTMGNPAMVEGSLFHAVLADYYKNPQSFAIKESLERNTHEFDDKGKFENINWGKTGSKEKSIKTVSNVLMTYFKNLPEYEGETKYVEMTFQSHIEDLDGEPLPVPLKGVMDLIKVKVAGYYVIDHKLVSKLYEQDEIVPAYEIQACTSYFLLEGINGYPPEKFIFNQVKKSANADKSPQNKQYVVEYTRDMLKRFITLYRLILDDMKNFKPLPSPFDMLNGNESYLEFIKNIEDEKK
jgi:hypothetical protein